MNVVVEKSDSETVANVGASDTVLTRMGISKEQLNLLQQSIQTAFNHSLEMMPTTVKTIADGTQSSLQLPVKSILQFMKNAE